MDSVLLSKGRLSEDDGRIKMDAITKAKDWINQNAPMLGVVYQNKYAGMIYDRFASLPAKQQRQILFWVIGGMGGVLFLYLLVSYYTLWSQTREAREAYGMIDMLMQYQKSKRDKSQYLQHLERNSQLSAPGEFKNHLLGQVKQSNISQRLVQVEEKAEADSASGTGTGGASGKKMESDVKVKQAMMVVDKVNLQQLKTLLTNIEFGSYNLSVPALQISNDDKIRGYMKAKFTVVAYLFQSEEGM